MSDKRISSIVRAEAVQALELCASDRAAHRFTCTWDVFGAFPRQDPADIIADLAFRAVPVATFDPVARYLEAAALLRDGWNPGDPVERLAKEPTNAR